MPWNSSTLNVDESETVLPLRGTQNRRTFLNLSLGGSLVAASAVGLRAFRVGLLNADAEPYRLWHEATTQAGFRDLVAAAVLAANPHNSQSWKFRVGEHAIDVLLDRSRALGPVDPFQRQMHIGIGCAIENLCVAAAARGVSAATVLIPEQESFDLAARIALSNSEVSDPRHADVIRRRHTNRGPYDRYRRLPDLVRGALERQATVGGARIELFEAESERGVTFSQVILAATTALIADGDFMRATDAWFRWTPREVADHADGPSLRCAGLAPALQVAAVLGPRQSPAKFHASWLASTRDVHLATAPTFGLITVPVDGRTREGWIEAGRLWQRVHLEATVHGLALQPLDQAIEAWERARQVSAAPVEPSASTLIPSGSRAAMMFRVGYPTRAAVPSARRPLGDVLLPPRKQPLEEPPLPDPRTR